MKFDFKAKLIKKNSNLMWNHRIEVPLEICEKLYPPKYTEAKRVKCTLNSKETIQNALTPNGKGNYYIILNKEIRKKLALEIGDEIEVEISKDESKYGIAFPKEMEELLLQDEDGNKVFHRLTPGKQRSLLHIIAKPKSENIRIKKAVAILEYLKSVNGKLDFKELNLAIKNANNR